MAVEFDPLRDKAYRSTGLGASAIAYLAWKDLSGAAERTLDDYERTLSKAALMFPRRGPEEFTSDMCLHVIRAYTRSQQRKVRAVLNDFFKWAVAWEGLVENPMVRVPVIKAPQPKIISIFDDDEEELLCLLPEIRDRALMILLFGSGLRKGEACKLTHGDIRFEQKRVIVRDGKGGKGRVIPVGRHVIKALSDLSLIEGLNAHDFLWFDRITNQHASKVRREKEIQHTAFHRWWVRCLTEAGVAYRNPHIARHTYATKYLRAGGRLERLSRILGHANVSITDRTYSHMTIEDLADDLDKVLVAREAMRTRSI